MCFLIPIGAVLKKHNICSFNKFNKSQQHLNKFIKYVNLFMLVRQLLHHSNFILYQCIKDSTDIDPLNPLIITNILQHLSSSTLLLNIPKYLSSVHVKNCMRMLSVCILSFYLFLKCSLSHFNFLFLNSSPPPSSVLIL